MRKLLNSNSKIKNIDKNFIIRTLLKRQGVKENRLFVVETKWTSHTCILLSKCLIWVQNTFVSLITSKVFSSIILSKTSLKTCPQQALAGYIKLNFEPINHVSKENFILCYFYWIVEAAEISTSFANVPIIPYKSKQRKIDLHFSILTTWYFLAYFRNLFFILIFFLFFAWMNLGPDSISGK